MNFGRKQILEREHQEARDAHVNAEPIIKEIRKLGAEGRRMADYAYIMGILTGLGAALAIWALFALRSSTG